jgi:hypothetical protein
MDDRIWDKTFCNEVKTVFKRYEQAIKEQKLEDAKYSYEEMRHIMMSHGSPEVRRDAGIAIEFIDRKYGGTNPELSITPDWRGDFVAINKRVKMAIRKGDIDELHEIVSRMNLVLQRCNSEAARQEAALVLLKVGEADTKLISFENLYVDLIKEELAKILNTLDENTYENDWDAILKKFGNQDKNTVKIVPSYTFFGNLVQYKVHIYNNFDFLVWDVRFRIIPYPQNATIWKVLPENTPTFEGHIAFLNTILPHSMKEVSFLLSPKQLQLFLEGEVLYRKPEGQPEIMPASHNTVDLVQIFPKLERIDAPGVMHCREAYDHYLKVRDLKAWALSKALLPETVYGISKQILDKLGFSQVLDIKQENPFYGETLYFGKFSTTTDIVSDKELVIIIRTSDENHSLELNIGAMKSAHIIAIQIQFEIYLKERLSTLESVKGMESITELRCPSCLLGYEKGEREFCPWCGFEFPILHTSGEIPKQQVQQPK